MNQWDIGELVVLPIWNYRHVKSGTLGLMSSFDLARGSQDIMSESVADNVPVPGSGGH